MAREFYFRVELDPALTIAHCRSKGLRGEKMKEVSKNAEEYCRAQTWAKRTLSKYTRFDESARAIKGRGRLLVSPKLGIMWPRGWKSLTRYRVSKITNAPELEETFTLNLGD